MNDLKKQSRIAASLYFLNALPAPFALLYVPSVLIVAGNALATANNVRDSETLLRFGIAGELFSSTVVIFAVLAFYSLFKSVSAKHASFSCGIISRLTMNAGMSLVVMIVLPSRRASSHVAS